MPSEWREGEGKGERKTERQGAKEREKERERAVERGRIESRTEAKNRIEFIACTRNKILSEHCIYYWTIHVYIYVVIAKKKYKGRDKGK